MGSLVEWKTVEIEKTLSTKRVKGAEAVAAGFADDGKFHVQRTRVQTIQYTYPVVDLKALSDPVDLAQAIQEILDAKRSGFMTLRGLGENLNYGLYNEPRSAATRGADLRYSTAQRNAIKAFGGMVQAGLLDKDVAVAGLLRQGVTDAEAAIDAFMQNPADQDAESVATTDGVVA